MNTQCPECHTIFNASQEQLDAAGGKVRCGHCDHIFNALEYLLEEETETTEPDQTIGSQDVLESDEPSTEAELIHDIEQTDTEDNVHTNDIDKEFPQESEFTDEITPIHELIPGDFIDIADQEAQEKSDLDDLPELLRANIREENTTKKVLANTLWGIGIILFIGTLILQYAYYSRTELVYNENLRPWIIRLCKPLNCSIPMKKDLAAIQLLSRDLSIHPRNKKILLINATMVSALEEPQPYPLIEIKLSNNRNEIVAMRRFKPEEYLPGSVDLEKGMPPQTPVNFKLETIRPQKEASTFQFDFY